MKKVLLTWLILSSILFATENKIVYITNTGEKYHESSCRYLKRSKIEIRLNRARENGYSPCGVCKP